MHSYCIVYWEDGQMSLENHLQVLLPVEEEAKDKKEHTRSCHDNDDLGVLGKTCYRIIRRKSCSL